MDQAPRPRRWQRGLTLGLAVVGAVVLGWALWGFLRVTISEQAPGPKAGGATLLVASCSRGLPADLAAACSAAGQQRAVAARRPLALAALVGGVLIVLSLGVGSATRRRRKNHQRSG